MVTSLAIVSQTVWCPPGGQGLERQESIDVKQEDLLNATLGTAAKWLSECISWQVDEQIVNSTPKRLWKAWW